MSDLALHPIPPVCLRPMCVLIIFASLIQSGSTPQADRHAAGTRSAPQRSYRLIRMIRI
eukprot:SAG11_NODE_1465_length_4859_cov_9.864916_3_plen_59_part_00